MRRLWLRLVMRTPRQKATAELHDAVEHLARASTLLKQAGDEKWGGATLALAKATCKVLEQNVIAQGISLYDD